MKKVFIALGFIAIFVVAGTITTALTYKEPAPAPVHKKLTIAQQAAAKHAREHAETELEAANIEGAFNRALNRLGSRTQAYGQLSFGDISG